VLLDEQGAERGEKTMWTCRSVVSGACLWAILTAAAAAAAEKGKEAATFDPVRQFEHIGIFTAQEKPGERFVAATKVWVTDIAAHPYRVEWLRFDPDSPVKGPVREQPHVAFRTDSIAEASRGLTVLIEPFDAGIARVGFYQTGDGATVEFMEYKK